MAENKFVPGMIAKAPRDGAPSFVKGSISVKIHEFRKFLDGLDPDQEWLNIDLKESQGGKLYAAINDWRRDGQRDSGGSGYHRQGNVYSQQQRQPNPVDDFDDSGTIPF